MFLIFFKINIFSYYQYNLSTYHTIENLQVLKNEKE